MAPDTGSKTPPVVQPIPCRFCSVTGPIVIDRRGPRVLLHCPACKLSWTVDEETLPSEQSPRPLS